MLFTEFRCIYILMYQFNEISFLIKCNDLDINIAKNCTNFHCQNNFLLEELLAFTQKLIWGMNGMAKI